MNRANQHLTRVLAATVLLLALLPTLNADPADGDNLRLFIHGGGQLGKLLDTFREMAGPEARLVVIPSALETPNPEAQQKKWQSRGYDSVTIMHATGRSIAEDPRFAESLKTATAVWFEGGVQQRYSALYANTSVEQEIIRLLERGGVVGGTSAGASIQTQAMISGGLGPGEVGRGFDILQGAVVDQHFLARNRMPRLMEAIRKNQQLIGYGIDEGTALVVEQGRMSVIGNSYVIRIKIVEGALQIDAFKAGDVLPLPKDEPR